VANTNLCASVNDSFANETLHDAVYCAIYWKHVGVVLELLGKKDQVNLLKVIVSVGWCNKG
jgi:hypothetical protein